MKNYKTITLNDQFIKIHPPEDVASFRHLMFQYKLNMSYDGEQFTIDATEKNIVKIVDTFTPLEYIICDDIINFYNIIKEWDITNVKNTLILSNNNNKLKEIMNNDIGVDPSLLLLHDRKIRYQYILPTQPIEQKSLVEHIAYRQNQKIWVDSNIYTLSNVINSLQQLQRLPILIIVENKDNNTTYNNLLSLSNALEENEITDNIGVYFRLSNVSSGKLFNQYISEKKYNSILDEQTKIVVIEYRNIPKFILSLGWKPMSVITINMNLRHTKVYAYTNQCDLVINYSTESSIIT